MASGRFPWKAVAAGVVAGGSILAIHLIREKSVSANLESMTPEQRAAALSKVPRVALIGDSYAEGLSPELAKLLPDFKSEYHRGSGTYKWVENLLFGEWGMWVRAFGPKIVLISLGVNDGSAPDIRNYQYLVNLFHGMGARVVWIMPPAAVNTASRDVIASLGVPTVPATTSSLAADGLHPRIYDQWAWEVAEELT